MSESWSDFKARGIPGRLEAAHQGLNPTVIARVPSGWAVMCDTQLLSGYVIQLPDPLVPHLNSLDLEGQTAYLRDMALIGRAVEEITKCKRVMYGIYGGLDPILHSHITPRYDWEDENFKRDIGHVYPHRYDPEFQFSLEKHGGLRAKLEVRLLELLRESDPS